MTAVRRAVQMQGATSLADLYMKEPTHRVYRKNRVPRVGNLARRLHPSKRKTVVMANQRVWYTPPESRDVQAIEQGQLLSIRGEVAMVLSAGGHTKLVPLQNMEPSWQTRLADMGFSIPSYPVAVVV